MVKLVDHHRYRRADGATMTVGGSVAEYPNWVWTLQGHWFRREDGRAITYADRDGHAPFRDPNWRDLVEEVFYS